MIFVVNNPMNCSDVNVFDTVQLAVEFLTNAGFSQIWSRDIKVSPRARFAFVNNNDETRYIYARPLNEVVAVNT